MKNTFKIKEISYSALFAALIAVGAWISIPMIVPVTLQTFVIFLSLYLFGSKRTFISLVIYTLLGIFGLPVFSRFNSGLGALMGPTGGFIVSFLLVPGIYALICLKNSGHIRKIVASIAALFVCYICGTLWYMAVFSLDITHFWEVLLICVIPFIIPDLVKLACAYLLSLRLKKFLK